jgi:NTP pyrophosphatase (non-canonical NTP hydrolase)
MPAPAQSSTSFEAINQLIWQHLEERDWQHNPARGLAISIALEANELLEHYQWRDEPVGDTAALAEELADIFIYAFQFAQTYEIDIAAAIQDKLAKAAQKYPAEEFKGKRGDDRKAAWLNAKLRHRKQGL